MGNKVDLERNVSMDLAQTLVGEDRFFHTYVETSPIYGIGMDEILNNIVYLSNRLLNLCD